MRTASCRRRCRRPSIRAGRFRGSCRTGSTPRSLPSCRASVNLSTRSASNAFAAAIPSKPFCSSRVAAVRPAIGPATAARFDSLILPSVAYSANWPMPTPSVPTTPPSSPRSWALLPAMLASTDRDWSPSSPTSSRFLPTFVRPLLTASSLMPSARSTTSANCLASMVISSNVNPILRRSPTIVSMRDESNPSPRLAPIAFTADAVPLNSASRSSSFEPRAASAFVPAVSASSNPSARPFDRSLPASLPASPNLRRSRTASDVSVLTS